MASRNSWSSTSCVLAKIEQILSCFICKQLMTEPYLLSSCDHYFCRQCITGVGTSCPQCNLPVWIKDVNPNCQLTTILCHIKKLKSLTTPINKTSDDITKQSSFVRQLSTHHSTRVPLGSVNYRWTCPTEQRTVKKKRQLDYMKTSKRIKYENSIITSCDMHSTVNEVPPSSLINKRNVRGETPLHIAAIKGDENGLTALLCQSADPNIQDHAGWTPLHEACNHGYKTIVEILLSHGALVNVPGYNNDTPLHDAVRNGHIDIVRLLVNNGANCCLRNHEGHTPNDLAITDSMKLALIPSPESTVVQMITPPLSISKHYVIISSGLKINQRKELYKVAKLLGADVVSEFTQNVTHVITESEGLCCPRTLKCLSAICIGCWLLSYQWLTKSLENGNWANEEDYLIQGFLFQGHALLTNAPKKCYLSTLTKAPRLFDGCEFFFKGLSPNHQPSKNELTKLVQLAGGKVLTREPKPSDENDVIFTINFCYPFHAPPESFFTTCHTFIVSGITSSRRINSCLAEVPFGWILDSLSHFKLIEF